MAAQLEVIEGPDKGWRYTVAGTGVRIGRGPAHQIRLNDPHWPDGDVGIEPHPGGYVVQNNMPHPVYLDGKPLPPGKARTLYHGATLQPTPGTLLRLGIVAAPGVEGVSSEAPPKPERGIVRRVFPWLLLAAAVGWHVYPLLQSPPPVDAAAADELKSALDRMEVKRGLPAPVRNELRFLRLTLIEAVYRDAEGRKAEAAKAYQELRDGLTRVWRVAGRTKDSTKPSGVSGAGWEPSEEDRKVLLALEGFVGDRLKANAVPAP